MYTEQEDLEIALRCVRKAYSVISGVSDKTALSGGVMSPVTEADLLAEKAMRSILEKERKDDAILGEEFGGKRDLSEERIWILDPIDGTINFTRSLPGWTVVCALTKKGKTSLSVVADDSGRISWATSEKVHFSGYASGATFQRDPKDLSQAIVATYFDKKRLDIEECYLGSQSLIRECASLRSFGSGTLELLLLASGKIDAFAQYDMHLWDYLPGELFVRASGGQTIQKGPWFVGARSDHLLQEILHILG